MPYAYLNGHMFIFMYMYIRVANDAGVELFVAQRVLFNLSYQIPVQILVANVQYVTYGSLVTHDYGCVLLIHVHHRLVRVAPFILQWQ